MGNCSRSHELDVPFLNDFLQPICGQPLTAMWRAIGQVFDFGEQKSTTNRRREAIARGDFALKFIYADWRITQGGRIILGSTDYVDGTWFYELEEPARGQFDEDARRLVHEFLEELPTGRLVAQSVVVSHFADITITLSNDLVIQSFGSSGESQDLWWCHNLLTDLSCLVGLSGHTLGKVGKP